MPFQSCVQFSLKLLTYEYQHKVWGITLFNVETRGVVAKSPEPRAHAKNARLKKHKIRTVYSCSTLYFETFSVFSVCWWISRVISSCEFHGKDEAPNLHNYMRNTGIWECTPGSWDRPTARFYFMISKTKSLACNNYKDIAVDSLTFGFCVFLYTYFFYFFHELWR